MSDEQLTYKYVVVQSGKNAFVVGRMSAGESAAYHALCSCKILSHAKLIMEALASYEGR
jgi:hypothetical protein